jgi:protoporphyrinogen IX oxidase
MDFLYVKALHIIFVVTWFSGLFYIVRLFVYHFEAEKMEEPKRSVLMEQYKIMEKRLWYGITWPSMIGTYIFGFWMVYQLFPDFRFPSWLILKLTFVFGLTLYHLQCGLILQQLKNDSYKHSSFKMRLWNEVATLFLVSVVFIVVLKNTLDWLWGVVGLVIFAVLLMVAIRIYRNLRKKHEEEKV